MSTIQTNPNTAVVQNGSTIARHEQQILDTSSIGVLITRISDGTILYANKAIAVLMGYTDAASVIGMPVPDFYWDPEVRQRILVRFRAEGRITNNEIRARRADGSMRWASISIYPFSFEGEQVLLSEIVDITDHKQAEEALKASEANLSVLFDSNPTGMVLIEQENRTIVKANAAAAKMIGVPKEEVIGRICHGFMCPAESTRCPICDLGQTVDRSERMLLKADGSRMPILKTVVQIKFDGKDHLLESFIDNTEHKQVEEAQRESEERFRRFTEVTVEGLVFHEQGRIIDANPAGLAMFGLSNNAEFIGRNLLEFIVPESHTLVLQQMQLESVKPYEIQCIREDGSIFPVETSTRTYKVGDRTIRASSIRDISERKRAEEALRDSQQLLQTVMDNIPLSVFWKDTQLNFLGCNRAFAADVGKASPSDVIGKSDFDMPSSDRAEEYRADDSLVIQSGTPKINYEEPQTTPDGSTNWLRTSKIPMRDADGKIFAMLGMYEDITEQKKLQQKVQDLFERRGFQVQISTEISQEIASAKEIGDLFARVVTLTKERLGYYHTQLLRYDAAQDAVVLISGYGETGQKMLASGHKLPMGSGLIGTAAASGQTVLRPTLTEDPDWQPNSLLPDTQGEIAVPIKLGEQILGVLDVQSDQAGSLTEDDRLLLEGICGQVAVAIEQTRLRQEMAERLEEVNRLYLSMSQEGWKTYRETADLPAGFMYDQAGLRASDEEDLADELFANIPMRVPGGEIVGTLTVANDPRNPTSDEDLTFLQQVSDQIALAMESARLAAQTQTALAQTEKLSEAGLRFAQSTNLQELLAVANVTLGISAVNRSLLGVFNYNSANDMEDLVIVANWWNGSGHEPSEIGRRYTLETLNALPFLMSSTPVFSNDTFDDERITGASLQLVKQQNIRSMAVLPLYLGSQQIGVVFLESEETYSFSQSDIRLFTAMAPQIATVLENRRQFERAQKQAERESTLNVISQKIQGATTVEAVLQIAARELGHALGAPMTIAQLSMKDKN